MQASISIRFWAAYVILYSFLLFDRRTLNNRICKFVYLVELGQNDTASGNIVHLIKLYAKPRSPELSFNRINPFEAAYDKGATGKGAPEVFRNTLKQPFHLRKDLFVRSTPGVRHNKSPAAIILARIGTGKNAAGTFHLSLCDCHL